MSEIIAGGTPWPSLDKKGVRVRDIMPEVEGFVCSHSVLEVSKDLQTALDVESSILDAPTSLWKYEKPVLHYCRADLLDVPLCCSAVRSDTRNLEYVPQRLLDKAVYAAALGRNGNLLDQVPPNLVDRELCTTAVKSRPMSLRHVPRSFIDEELCEAALSVAGVGLQFVPEELRSNRLCMIALTKLSETLSKNYGIRGNAQVRTLFLQSFRSVPSNVMDRQVCELAVRALPQAIESVPEDIVDKDICLAAIASPLFTETASLFLEWIPTRLLTPGIIDSALDASGKCLAGLDGRRRTKARCERAVRSNPQALRFVPERFVTPGLCRSALEADPSVFCLIPEDMLTPRLCEAAVTRNWRDVRLVPDNLLGLRVALDAFEGALVEYSLEASSGKRSVVRRVLELRRRLSSSVLRDPRIRFLERRIGLRQLDSCEYNTSNGRFIVRERVLDSRDETGDHYRNSTTTRRGLKALSEYLMSDLADVCLADYELTPEEQEAFRSTDIMTRELWDGIAGDNSRTCFRCASVDSQPPAIRSDTVLSAGDITVFYVTDIHLRHRMLARYPDGATDHDVKSHIRHLARSLASKRGAATRDGASLLLVGGDTSDSFLLATLFYIELAKVWDPRQVYVVLGNHELWSAPVGYEGRRAVDDVVAKYRRTLSELGMTLLHNELVMRVPSQNDIVFGPDKILDPSATGSLVDAADKASIVLFGGIGFSTLSPDFNFESGIYRHAIRTAEQESEQSRLVDETHRRLVQLFGRRTVVFLTHMPIWCWSKSAPNRNWAYVSGHTHHNGLEVWERGGHYHDAQVAYDMDGMLLGHFSTPGTRDIFWRYGDGAYRISHAQYREFNRNLGINCRFGRQGEVLMLKRGGYYLFLMRHEGRVYRLEGGMIHGLGSWDAGSMYDALALYAEASKAIFSGYQSALNRISDEIRSFGGYGTVHGSIVDIDYYSHVYVDPLGEGVRYYFSTSPSPEDRIEYKDMRSLLREMKPELLPAYEREASQRGLEVDPATEGLSVVRQFDDALVRTTYARSRVTRSFQYLFETNIVRTWDDGILEALAEIANGSNEDTLHARKTVPALSGQDMS